MMNGVKSIELYKELLKIAAQEIKEYTTNFPTHERQFIFDELSEECYKKMYMELRRSKIIVSRLELFTRINGLKNICASCWKFYIPQRTKSIKSLDIEYGKKFELKLIEFLNKLNIKCKKSRAKKNYPDIVVFDKNSKIVAYLEVKYLAAPFVKVYEKVPGRECYEGSTTLDVEKIRKQRRLIETEIKKPVFYVYWLDYPCIKGIFYMPAKKVFDYADQVGIEWSRKERNGDFVTREGIKIKVGATDKIYLPLLEMGSFSELIDELRKLAG